MSSTKPELKFSGAAEENQFYRKYFQLPPKDNSAIRFLDHNNHEYFTVLNEDAEYLADNFYRTRSVIKGSDKKKHIAVSPQNFKELVKFCLKNHLKIEIYNDRTFQLVDSASAGNLERLSEEYDIDFEFDDGSSSSIAAIKLGKKVGVSVVVDSTIYFAEFEDNDAFSNLESLLIQLGVKEALFPSSVDNNKFMQALNRINDLQLGTIKSFPKDVGPDLEKLLDTENVELSLAAKGLSSTDHSLSLSCCGALIDYLDLLSSSKTFTIEKYNLTTFMKLDSSTMRALNVFPAGNQRAVTSIYELFKCKTSAGSKLLSQWLKQPLIDLSAIEERQKLVELMLDDTSLRVEVQDFLAKVPDIMRIFKRIGSKKSGNDGKKLNDVVGLYNVVQFLPSLIEVLTVEYYLEPLRQSFATLQKFCELVETSIELDVGQHEDNKIKPDFSPQLGEIQERMTSTMDSINQLHYDAGDDLNVEVNKKLKLENHQTHGWCFRLTRIESVIIRGNRKYEQLQTQKSGVLFTTKELKRLSNEYVTACDQYNRAQREVVAEIISLVMTYEGVFASLSATLGHLDVISALATSAMLNSYTKPTLHPFGAERKISLAESRHPLLEVQDDINFIANDVSMDANRFVVITGPNMGGKSTYIRQIGVVSLLAQIGSFVPANEGAELPIFDAILSRVGAGDSQLKGLSTFMIEMLETSSILATATENSLIIIDELGRGTSTYDGFGLAWAILEHLIADKKCFAMFATHFHELNKLAEKYPGQVQNLHVVAQENEENDITLMYKVEPGISDKSFGIHVAELVKFPQKIVNMAKRKAEELSEEPPTKKRCSPEEVREGMDRLKTILKQWRNDNPTTSALQASLSNESNKFILEIVEEL
ncbi:DNA mismatch repair protein MSH2 [Candida viswanathii]|uniref:DNA mismatch repair protein MSH3 n=1 Tax=Candida viswanathii TaxID=5486 RepID=A0A367XTY8_9ASCO|nr:DNA mismatch repair protein MSH2 [Candida viswanathii]